MQYIAYWGPQSPGGGLQTTWHRPWLN